MNQMEKPIEISTEEMRKLLDERPEMSPRPAA